MTIKILEMKNVNLGFMMEGEFVKVVRGVDFFVNSGEIVGILGESGSGKSVTAKSIFRIAEEEIINDDGTIFFENQEITKMNDNEMTKLRFKKIAYIPQNPSDALNPYQTVYKQFKELSKIHKVKIDKNQIVKSLRDVGIENPDVIMNMYVHQLSGGLAQRVVFAMSIILEPPLIIADEPTSSIDASLKKVILDVLKTINEEKGISIIVITHDFDVVKYLADRIYVMYGGLVLEEGNYKDVMNMPMHPYTKELMKCVASIENTEERFYSMEGSPENPKKFKEQCPFIDRCSEKNLDCEIKIPEMISFDNHNVRCVKYKERF
ncbi:MAG: ABC transporter ATP-binding protein [Clostridiales bacterium]|nr:ABC transporter ATP-binding protein [Clostridiales bacterium]